MNVELAHSDTLVRKGGGGGRGQLMTFEGVLRAFSAQISTFCSSALDNTFKLGTNTI